MSSKQVQIPYELYQNLVQYHLLGQVDDFNIVLKIEQGLRAKQDALMKRVEYHAQLIAAGRKDKHDS